MISRRLAGHKEISNFVYDGDEAELLKAFDWRKQLETYLALGPVWIFEDDQEALVLVGYFQLSPGVLQLWMLFNKAAKNYPYFITREGKAILKEAMQTKGIHRIQTLIDKTKKKDADYAKAVGFTREGMLEAFGPKGEDVMMYKIVRKPKCS